MDRIVALAKGKPGVEHCGGSLGGSCSGSFRPTATGPAVCPAAPWIWPGKREGAKRPRVTRPQRAVWEGRLRERRRSERRTPQRRSRSRMAGMSNTPPAWPWLSSGDSARSQPLADDLEKRFPEDTFVQIYLSTGSSRVIRARAGSRPRRAWSDCKSLCTMSWR